MTYLKAAYAVLKELYLGVYCPLFAWKSLLGNIGVVIMFMLMGDLSGGIDFTGIVIISMFGLIATLAIIFWGPLYSVCSVACTGLAGLFAIVPVIGPIIAFVGMYLVSFIAPFAVIAAIFVWLMQLNEAIFGSIFIVLGLLNLVAGIVGTVINFVYPLKVSSEEINNTEI